LRISNIAPVALTVSGPLLDDRPDLVTRYVAASLRAARWAEDRQAETHRILAHEVGIAEELAAPAYTPDVHANLSFSLDDDLVVAIESQRDFLLEHGYIADSFDVREWIAEAPLQEARALLASQA
jgi:ABC-type nitrate/sulfonate/bicarbonate transport system substrate-binding protein